MSVPVIVAEAAGPGRCAETIEVKYIPTVKLPNCHAYFSFYESYTTPHLNHSVYDYILCMYGIK